MKMKDAFTYVAMASVICAAASPATKELGEFIGDFARVASHTMVDPSAAQNAGMAVGILTPVIPFEGGRRLISAVHTLFQLSA